MPRKRVLQSIETDAGDRCIDLFQRPDKSFGFEVYRKDGEDGRGWYPVGGFEAKPYASEEDMRAAARRSVPWIDWDAATPSDDR